jgi:hypothetical protein
MTSAKTGIICGATSNGRVGKDRIASAVMLDTSMHSMDGETGLKTYTRNLLKADVSNKAISFRLAMVKQ